jgi:para-aminobenzoate synthetase component 1
MKHNPYVTPLDYCDPLRVFAVFAAENGAIFLDSANHSTTAGTLNRYAFIAVDPFQQLICKNGKVFLRGREFIAEPFAVLEEELARFELDSLTGLPPFQGGAAGYFAYGMQHYLEKISGLQKDTEKFPDLAIGFYDLVIGFDLLQRRAWIFSSGYPLQETAPRRQRAKERSEWLRARVQAVPPLPDLRSAAGVDIKANFTAATYCAAVERAQEYIFAGDIFQVNISQTFSAVLPAGWQPLDLYRRLRIFTPAPFAAFLRVNEAVILSASPERFIKAIARQVETRPIKGTRSRGQNHAEDQQLAADLLASAKDRAENIMIVDLLRNDLSRVCRPHSVQVPQLCSLESHATVHHLVSVVTGELPEDVSNVSLLRATFPGGSVTGAPKIRAMEIIAELEPSVRGPYCGCIGYIGFDGSMDTSIVIRTFTLRDDKITFQAGGAVVADSDPQAEYAETLTKARALLAALQAPLYEEEHAAVN